MQKDRSDVFSISMIELLLIIMFALLIVMVLLNNNLKQKQDILDDLREQLQIVESTLHEIHDNLGTGHHQHSGSLDINEAVAQLQALAEELNTSFNTPEAKDILAKMKIDDVWTSLTRITDNNFDAHSLIKRIEELKAEVKELKEDNINKSELISQKQVIENQINKELASLKEITNHEDGVKGLLEEYKDRAEYLKEILDKSKEKNINLQNQVKYLARNGLVHPPCWSDPKTGKIEYTFKIIVTDTEVYVENIFPEYRHNEYLSITNHRNYDGMSMSPEKFKSEMQVFLKDAKQQNPECRYFSVIQDKTSASSKKEWKSGLQSVESSFYKLEI